MFVADLRVCLVIRWTLRVGASIFEGGVSDTKVVIGVLGRRKPGYLEEEQTADAQTSKYVGREVGTGEMAKWFEEGYRYEGVRRRV